MMLWSKCHFKTRQEEASLKQFVAFKKFENPFWAKPVQQNEVIVAELVIVLV
jgi:hypothetical protein